MNSTRWLISVTAHSREDDAKVMRLMQQAARLGLPYTVSSKEIKNEAKSPSGDDSK